MLAPSFSSTVFFLPFWSVISTTYTPESSSSFKCEVAVVVACRLGHDSAVLEEPDARALDAIDDASGFGRDRTANEAFRVAPEIAVIDPRLGGEFGTHHLETFVFRHARHVGVFDVDRSHRAGRARLVAPRLLPTLIDEMGVEGPGLRHLVLLVPPDVPVGTCIDQIFATLREIRVDQHDAIVAL